MINIFKGTWRK